MFWEPWTKEGTLNFDWLFIVGGNVRVLLSLVPPQIACSLPAQNAHTDGHKPVPYNPSPLYVKPQFYHSFIPSLKYFGHENVFRAQDNEWFYLKQITYSNTWAKVEK